LGSILVIGSSNTDMVVKTSNFPKPGETVLGGEFFMFPGGKGANQAVAAARLGAETTFITKLGRDIFGDKSFDGFKIAGIDCRYIQWDNKNPSGVAMITINEKGENHIVVAPGANNTLLPIDLDRAELAFLQAELILMQLEIPIETVRYAADKAAANGKKIILNPAPAHALPDELLSKLYLFTPNETEAAFYSGLEIHDIESAGKSAEILLAKGIQNVVITMGAQGAFFKNASEEMMIPSPKVEAVDTTAAGDVFNGALCVALSEHMSWNNALTWACRAAAFSVTKMGAQSGAPTREELAGWQFTVDS
jgi:ribokinase